MICSGETVASPAGASVDAGIGGVASDVPQADVDVVIVNWNAGNDLTMCVDSVRATAAGRVNRIVVVDNASTDGSLDTLGVRPDLHVVHATRNLGFAAGANLGARHARSRLLLFLNPDARVLPGAIAAAAAYHDARIDTGIVGALLVDGSGTWQPSAGRFNALTHLLLDTRLTRRPPRCSQSVDWIHGAFLLIEGALFKRLGGFDERFFMYGEDMDLCARARTAGYGTAIVPAARIIHLGNRSGAQRFGEARDCEVLKAEIRFYAWSGRARQLPMFRVAGVLKYAAKAGLYLLGGRRRAAARAGALVRTCASFIPERSVAGGDTGER